MDVDWRGFRDDRRLEASSRFRDERRVRWAWASVGRAVLTISRTVSEPERVPGAPGELSNGPVPFRLISRTPFDVLDVLKDEFVWLAVGDAVTPVLVLFAVALDRGGVWPSANCIRLVNDSRNVSVLFAEAVVLCCGESSVNAFNVGVTLLT